MFFQVENVTERIYRISMPYVCCYLIVGKDKAILIDCGWGYGDIKDVVETLTDLPVTLILSHGHSDHLGGAVQFEDAYLHEDDFELAISQSEIDVRKFIMMLYVSEDFVEDSALWLPPRTKPYKALKEGMTFDLGGITLLPFELPGHSIGHMVFIIPEERIAIFGDAISHPTVIYLDEGATIQAHHDAMVKFSEHSHLYDRVLVNHESFEINKIVLENNIKLAKAILEGKDEKVPAARRSRKLLNKGPIYAARKTEPWLPADPDKIGNIYYREDKV